MVKGSNHNIKSISLGFGLIILGQGHALADDFVVSLDSTATNGGFTIDGADTLTVNSGISLDRTGLTLSPAVNTTGGNNTVTNNGSITGDATSDARGVVFNGTLSTLNNNGGISTLTATAHAFEAIGNRATVNNTGSVVTTGNTSHALYFSGSSAGLINNGSIHATGAGSDGVRFNGSTNSLTTSGVIVSRQSNAIFFGGGENFLNLNAPAYVEGAIVLANSTFVTINSGQSHSFQWAFTGAPWFAMLINGSVPTVISGTTVASIDPTVFQETPNAMYETTGHVFNAIAGRTQSIFPGSTTNLVVSTKYGPVADDPVVAAPSGARKWVSGYGGAAWHKASGVKLAHMDAQMGLVAGIDWSRGPDRIFGLAVGGGGGAFAANAPFMKSHRVQSFTGFANIYGARRLGQAVLDYGLMGGIQSHNSQRFINNNAILGGIDTARATYGSSYLAPRVSLRRSFDIGTGLVLTTTGSLGYVAGHVNGYTETATASTATYSARNFGLGTAQIKAKVTKFIGATAISGNFGIISQTGFGNEPLSGTLLGQAWTYTTANTSGLSGLVGVALEHQFGPNMNGAITTGANVSSAGLSNIKGSASLRIEF